MKCLPPPYDLILDPPPLLALSHVWVRVTRKNQLRCLPVLSCLENWVSSPGATTSNRRRIQDMQTATKRHSIILLFYFFHRSKVLELVFFVLFVVVLLFSSLFIYFHLMNVLVSGAIQIPLLFPKPFIKVCTCFLYSKERCKDCDSCSSCFCFGIEIEQN